MSFPFLTRIFFFFEDKFSAQTQCVWCGYSLHCKSGCEILCISAGIGVSVCSFISRFLVASS